MSNIANEKSELMNVSDVANYLRISRASVYRLAKQRKIPVSRIGKHLRFRKETLDIWLHHNTEGVGARILVVDDDEPIRSLFKVTLEEEGHKVVTASTGAKGLAYVMQQNFDLIFLDLNMSGTDGAEILREMRGVKRKLPVVIITGYPDSEMMERAMKQGPLGVMNKPFDAPDIIAAVNSFLHTTQTREPPAGRR